MILAHLSVMIFVSLSLSLSVLFHSLKFVLLLLNCFDLFLVWSVLFRVMKDYMVFKTVMNACFVLKINILKTKLSFLNCVLCTIIVYNYQVYVIFKFNL